jgi:dTDP-4-amino-4,6-dideoxygalactose transaminase
MKKNIKDLALFGGDVLFKEPIHVGQMNFPDKNKVKNKFKNIFKRRYFANNGPLVQRLDNNLQDYFGVEHAVSVTNGTLALMLAAKALELKGNVIVPAFTFVATVEAMEWVGLTPVFCDIDSDTHQITPELIEPLINEETSAIVAVHLWGRICDVEGLQKLANKYSLKLLFDASHAVGCSYKGQLASNFGDIETFSMHSTKILNAGEGGCITTNNSELANKLKTFRNFYDNYITDDVIPSSIHRINAKMSEAQAALGLLGLENIQDYICSNKKSYYHYKEGLLDINGIKFLTYNENEQHNYQYMVIQIDETAFGISRDELLIVLESEQILARRYFYPGIHKMALYEKYYKDIDDRLQNTKKLSNELMQLPIGQSITLQDIDKITQLFRLCFNYSGQLKQMLDKKIINMKE